MVAAAMVVGALGAPAAHADDPSAPANTAPANTAPVAVPDTLQMVSGATVRIDPRLNDTDPDGEPLSIVVGSSCSPGRAAWPSKGPGRPRSW